MTKEDILTKLEYYVGPLVYDDLSNMLDELERTVVIDGVEYVTESPVIKTISKDGEVVISGFKEVKG